MNLVAIITDTHYGARKNSKEFHDYFNLFYENVFFPTLEKYNVSTVIHLGDAFDNRKSIDYQSFEWTKKNIFDKLKNYTVHMITGNHDCYFKNTNKLNAPSLLLNSYDNISVYDEVCDIDILGTTITMVPWINSENETKVMSHLQNTKSNVVMGHLEINGFEAHPGHTFDGGLERNIFQKFSQVFSGHFHHKSVMDNIHYLGNPYEITWSDYNERRGFHLYDLDTGEIKFFQNPYKMFRKFYYNDKQNDYINFDLSEYKNTHVKVIVENKTDTYLFDKIIEKFYSIGIYDLKIIEDNTIFDSDDEIITAEHEDTLSTLQKFIEDMKDNYDKPQLKTIVKSIYVEACEVQ
jgi:hypothetical protein